MRATVARIVVGAALAAFALGAPLARHRFIRAMTDFDARPGDPAPLPAGTGPGLAPVAHTRVLLIDGLSADTAATLPNLRAQCARGLELTVDVGFPTISLPVEVELWSGLTQQQTGYMFRSDRPLVPPLAHGIPAQVAGSRAVAENHGWIVRSLGFADVQPAADPQHAALDLDAKTWATQWQARAHDAVASDAPLVFVHVLRVDTAGHRGGHDSAAYRTAASEADAVLGELVAAAPAARWFLLSDHGHLPGGGHGGRERAIRQVTGCIVGPGIAAARGGLVHAIDVARAIADSTGATLDPASRGRPLSVALASPLGADQAIPPLALGAGVLALFVLVAGLVVTALGTRRWWLAPWWFAGACVALVLVRGEPTLSTPMIYAPAGRAMYLTWLALLPLCAATAWFGLGRVALWRVLAAQLALPLAAVAAAAIACGAWRLVLGEHVAPVVPRYSAYLSPLLLIAAHGCAAVALAVLGRCARSAFGRPSPAGTPRSEPAGD